MIVEALSFKLSLDFLSHLKQNGLNTSNIKVQFWDKTRYEFTSYKDITAMSSFFNKKYSIIDNCVLGNLCELQFFEAESNLYNFLTNYKAINVTGSYKLETGSSFDIERKNLRKIFTDKQSLFINKSVGDYLSFLRELKNIYVTGIYSPCYAQPGWSKGTSMLKELRNGLIANKSKVFT